MVSLYFTIDTEYESGFTARRGAGSREANFDRSIRGRTATGDGGIFHQMDVFDAHGLKAVFFVDPMPALIWGTGAIADIVEPVLKRGHDVQLHLHTEWLAIAGDRNPLGERTGPNLKHFSFDEQCQLLDLAIGFLMDAGAPRPVAFRAGNYGANDDSLRALAANGLTHDTSHPPGLMDAECEIGLADNMEICEYDLCFTPRADWQEMLCGLLADHVLSFGSCEHPLQLIQCFLIDNYSLMT